MSFLVMSHQCLIQTLVESTASVSPLHRLRVSVGAMLVLLRIRLKSKGELA